MHLGIQIQEQHSSSTESISLSHHEFTAMDKTSSQDQSPSSESVHDEGTNGQNMKSAMFACNPDLSTNVSQAENSQSMIQFSYPYPDPYLGGLFTAYGPHSMFQPQVMGATAGRVAIPADLPADGPIYVNAKQYHGIMRRRQIRAKLEAQNKLVKNRRPYLHESRHQHAVKRVRGTGGRFLSTKKPHHSDSNQSATSQNPPGSFHFNQMGTMSNAKENLYVSNHHGAPSSADLAVPSTDAGYMVISMQDTYNGNRHYNASSIVR